ncbi:MAG: c-type cytochrome [Cyclobacteriaceae bacterium]|nr:c-type cytochrome [Cyclobacteriaceae bacterium]MDH4296085.1 c-type cytochrome [Cyclobacteriaceae bacterium]MDH5249762.1 c-type cytochrome [Cyclobacteriaceae bacterium]
MKKHFRQTTSRFTIQILLLNGLLSFTGCQKEPVSGQAQDALSTFELEPGFKIELVAAEPLITDPVDMEIDEYGRLYVVEMPGYPLDKSGSGKIVLLRDTDGDGQMDNRTVFADQLVLPNSIMRWKNGVIVTDAPNVLYLEDADGDGRAEIRDTLLTGFALSNPQHNLNSPVLGIDNWIYLAHEGAVGTEMYAAEFGDPGQEVYFPDKPQSPRLRINAGGRAVRFRPDQHELEMTSSYSQFGHTFDAWGHHLEVSNSNHIFQEVIPETYLKRNPDLLVSDATESLSDHGSAAEVFPITINPEHQLLTDVGAITSACGIAAYLGGAFPPPYDRTTFVAEPVSNLVHVDQLEDKGATFTASRMRPHKEFLASKDPKFRPVNMYIGPDGALYIVDYYRQIIEHPEWMGEEVVKSGALYNDTDKGRIYRITTTDASPADWTKGLTLGDNRTDQLVENLSSPNIWWRLNAQRLLIDRADKGAVPALFKMANNQASPLGRLHALWTLEGMGELTPEQIELALKDPVAGIRENAIKLTELHLIDAPHFAHLLLGLQEDVNPKVRYQLLCTLGFLNTPEAAEARHRILFQDVDDKWVQVAALSASSSQTSALLNDVLRNYRKDTPAYASLTRRLTTMLGATGKPSEIRQLIQKATEIKSGEHDWNGPVLEGLAQGMETKASAASLGMEEQRILINAFFEHPSTEVRKGSLHLLKVTGITNESLAQNAIEKAVTIAKDPQQPDNKRADAIDFISLRNPVTHSSLLMQLFVPTEQLSIQLAALRTLSIIPDTTVCGFLIRQWPVLTPELRDPAVKTFFASDPRIEMLLNAIADGKIPATELSWPRKVTLMNYQSNDPLRNKARALFTKNNDDEINKAYQQALHLEGDAINGKNVYQLQCALCHQVRGELGIKFGPDLATIHNWSREAIMANILAPNQSISSGYDLWEVTLTNGEKIQGIISSETPGAITLQNTGSPEKTISRKDVKSLRALSLSAMPSGLEKQINLQQMADLLAFLKENK